MEDNKIVTLEVRVGSLEKRVDCIEYLPQAFEVFKEEIRLLTRNFIFWLIGMIVSSLVIGLAFQYKSFIDVHKAIFNLEKRIIIYHGDDNVHNDN